jgi:hypothetical protein
MSAKHHVKLNASTRLNPFQKYAIAFEFSNHDHIARPITHFFAAVSYSAQNPIKIVGDLQTIKLAI